MLPVIGIREPQGKTSLGTWGPPYRSYRLHTHPFPPPPRQPRARARTAGLGARARWESGCGGEGQSPRVAGQPCGVSGGARCERRPGAASRRPARPAVRAPSPPASAERRARHGHGEWDEPGNVRARPPLPSAASAARPGSAPSAL